jgi:RNA polymerase sigma-70 factor (ECF subfamily)
LTIDSTRFEREVVALLPDLYGAALRLARNPADAEDLVAEAVARAWIRRATLKDPDSFRGWVFRILTNDYISRWRARAGDNLSQALEETEALDEETFSLFEKLHQPFLLWWGNPEQEFLNQLLREDLERAVDSLPECFRVVVVLADLQGFSYREIAESLELPIGTVRSRLARGRSLLQKELAIHAADAGLKPVHPEKEFIP